MRCLDALGMKSQPHTHPFKLTFSRDSKGQMSLDTYRHTYTHRRHQTSFLTFHCFCSVLCSSSPVYYRPRWHQSVLSIVCSPCKSHVQLILGTVVQITCSKCPDFAHCRFNTRRQSQFSRLCPVCGLRSAVGRRS